MTERMRSNGFLIQRRALQRRFLGMLCNDVTDTESGNGCSVCIKKDAFMVTDRRGARFESILYQSNFSHSDFAGHERDDA